MFSSPAVALQIDLDHHMQSVLSEVTGGKGEIYTDVDAVGNMVVDEISGNFCWDNECVKYDTIPSIERVQAVFESLGLKTETQASSEGKIVVNLDGSKVTYKVTEEGTTDADFIKAVILLDTVTDKVSSASCDGLSTAYVKPSGLQAYRHGGAKRSLSEEIFKMQMKKVVENASLLPCGGIVGVAGKKTRTTTSRKLGDVEKSGDITTSDIANYQITMWLSIGLIVTLFSVVMMLTCMDPNMDNMVSTKHPSEVAHTLP